MADKKISALTASTTPLAGTEVLPIVQGGSTVKVSIANLTAGRAVNALSATTTAGLRNTSAGSDTASTPDGVFLTDAGNKNAIVQLSASGGVSTFIFEAGGAGWRRVTGLLTNGNSVVDVGNVVIGTAGKGIDFSANGGDVLKQYDEGTFTPVFNSFTIGDGNVSGRYTRVGRLVTVTMILNFGATSAWTGACSGISGLPFPSPYRANGCMTLHRTSVAWYAGQIMIYEGQSQTSYPSDAAGAVLSATTPWTWGAGDFIVATITYEV